MLSVINFSLLHSHSFCMDGDDHQSQTTSYDHYVLGSLALVAAAALIVATILLCWVLLWQTVISRLGIVQDIRNEGSKSATQKAKQQADVKAIRDLHAPSGPRHRRNKRNQAFSIELSNIRNFN